LNMSLFSMRREWDSASFKRAYYNRKPLRALQGGGVWYT